MSFKVGDRVVVVSGRYDEAQHGAAPVRGTTGTLMYVSHPTVLFETDAPCGNRLVGNNRWALYMHEVELLPFDKDPLTQASEAAFDAAYAPPVGVLPEDSAERKTYPLHTIIAGYFPSALAEIAHHSYVNNEVHNPGQPLHWSRNKSNDHLEAAMRHLIEDDLVGAAWRVLAALQLRLEEQGHPVPFAAKYD